jgi:hypothetical protein
MMDQAGVVRTSIFAVAVSMVATVLCAQDAQPAPAAQAPAATATPPAAAKPAAAAVAPVFEPLIRIVNVQGACEVNNPDIGKYEPIVNNKAYPLGSTVRTGPNSSALLVFSTQESIQILEKSEIKFSAAEKTAQGRLIRLVAGTIKTNLRDNLPEGSFTLTTANALCKNLAGRGEFSLTVDGTLETFQAAIITGIAQIEGAQYHLPALRAANTVNIQTSADHLLSRLTSVSGDFNILLDNGTETPVSYGMSPKAVVKIWRENAPVGGRAIISTLVVSPTGMARHRFAYAEGRPNLSTGELIAAQEGDEKEKKDDLPVLLTKETAAKGEAAANTQKKEKEK